MANLEVWHPVGLEGPRRPTSGDGKRVSMTCKVSSQRLFAVRNKNIVMLSFVVEKSVLIDLKQQPKIIKFHKFN